MKSFIPTLTLGVALPKQTDWEDKYGGLPWGLPVDQWPICRGCDAPLSFLAQFRHHSERLDLGKENRALFLFQCESGCASWVMDSGCNAVIILDQEQLHTHTTHPPNEEIEILPELRVRQWNAHHEHRDRQFIETKLKGEPDWIQGEESPGEPYYFTGQIDSALSCTKDLPKKDGMIEKFEVNGYHSIRVTPEIGRPFFISIKSPDSPIQDHYRCDFANFGDMGIGYLFVNPDRKQPTGKFSWQCH